MMRLNRTATTKKVIRAGVSVKLRVGLRKAVGFGLLEILLLLSGFSVSRAEQQQREVSDPHQEQSQQILSRKAMPGFAMLGNLGLLPANKTTFNYGGWITPEQVPGIVDQHRFTIQVPVYRGDRDSVSISAGGSSLHFGEQQSLDTTGILVPQNFWRAEVGGMYSHRIENDKLIGGRLSIGSASDRPFANLDVTIIGASMFYSWASSLQSRWILALFYSNNNPIINYAPIPGFIYFYQTPTLIGLFGFPFSSVIWRPIDLWMFTLSVFGPTVNTEIAYGNPNKIQIFTGYSFLQQLYMRFDRPNSKDRLYYAEMHIPVGVRFPLVEGIKSEFSIGYSFNRSVYEGTSFTGKQNGNANLGASWFAAWNLSAQI